LIICIQADDDPNVRDKMQGIECETYLVAIVRPGGPFKGTSLLIKGKELYIYVAAAAKNTVAQPDHLARVTDDHVCIDDR